MSREDTVKAYIEPYKGESILGYSIDYADEEVAIFVVADTPLPPFPPFLANFEVVLRPLDRPEAY